MNHQTKSESKQGTVSYKCSACGVIHDGNNGAPSSCMKCDNEKFYKIVS